MKKHLKSTEEHLQERRENDLREEPHMLSLIDCLDTS